MYDNCLDVDRDSAEAIKWYKLAAGQGHVEAQYNLGCMYHYGKGVDEDYAEAIKWYQLAADQGDVNAQHRVDNLLQQHTELAQQQPTDPHTPPS